MTRFAAISLITFLLAALVRTAAMAQTGMPVDDAATVHARAAFVDAYRSATQGETAAVTESALADYPLLPYLDAARLEHALVRTSGEATDADRAAQAFIEAHRSEPVARRVLSSWLESLARRQRWQQLFEHYDAAAGGVALECLYLQAGIELGETRAIEDAIRARWLTGAQLPAECEPVFEWGRARDVIDEDAIAARVALLLENGRAGFARIIARRLPDAAAEPYLGWARLIEAPEAAFDALIASPEASPGTAAVLDAWTRFARNRPAEALTRVAALIEAHGRDRASASLIRRALAFGLAWDRRAGDALEQFAAVRREDMDDYAREWQTRAALWSRAWPTAADSIAAMSQPARADSAWRYWAGRAAAELDDATAARAAFEQVLGDDNFYSAVAAARLGRAHRPAHAPLDVEDRDLARIARMPGFVRARELHAVGLENDARREWNAVYETLPETSRLASIRLAASWRWHEIAVLTATRNGVFYDYELLYPQAFTEHVPVAADLTAFDRSLLYALIRQESLFAADAVSSAGAIGLTQLRLETAQRAAARQSLARPSRATLFDPQTNITLGAAELRHLIDEFDGQLLPGLAGYNAGYNAAARWLPEDEIDADIWVENIPYNETRAYVRRVLWHSLVYGWLETGRPQDASAWLEPIRRP